ncbi:glycosyltransferase [Flaviaesturariibacter flavus]|uniref:Glycosyltransferase n=1 Tax=Flaviaesturariibacter flavus TaxID=2502780 RepID=A0A4R1BPR2_9BACT|nr:WecB/TagA/CpsF family glycosyltransferase [Flaviaesturariibacter flavus]TCJ19317.1 glycosyltransferase [Flaviaesturariibacter flavus]
MIALQDQVCRLIHRITRFDSFSKARDYINAHLEGCTIPIVLSFVNAHAVNLCYSEPGFIAALLESDVLLRDGVGVSTLYRILNIDPGFNFCGTDFIPFLLRTGGPRRIALLGTTEPYLGKAADRLRGEGHEIVLMMDGFRKPEDYLDALEPAAPDVVLLGMGMPKQEFVSAMIRTHYTKPLLVINGGACIDFMGEKVKRAPLWMRRGSLEWVFRLLQEPRRMYRRYLVGNMLFLARAVCMRGRMIPLFLSDPKLQVHENSSHRIGWRALD